LRRPRGEQVEAAAPVAGGQREQRPPHWGGRAGAGRRIQASGGDTWWGGGVAWWSGGGGWESGGAA
jgi:hypothetical protein